MEKILSPKNERVKRWKKLHTRKGREKAQAYLIEGFHLIDEAIKSEAGLIELIVSQELWNGAFPEHLPENKIILVSSDISKQLSETASTQGIFAVIQIEQKKAAPNLSRPYLFLDNIQDPGNVGTMIRTADAAGFEGIVLGNGTADLYNSKVLRSMQGSHFHLSIYQSDLIIWFELFQGNQLPVYGTELNEQATSYQKVERQEVFALVMGNEGSGMDKRLLQKTTKNLYIPIKGRAESLNVAVAAGILMFSLTPPSK